MRACRGRSDFIRELLNFPGKVKVEIQPEGPIAHKIKKGDRTLVEDEHKHSTFQGQWGYSRNPRTPEKALLGTIRRSDVIPGGRTGPEEEMVKWLLHLSKYKRHWCKYSYEDRSLQKSLSEVNGTEQERVWIRG